MVILNLILNYKKQKTKKTKKKKTIKSDIFNCFNSNTNMDNFK